MRLSLVKGAHAILSRAAYRKFGASRSFFARCGIPQTSPSSLLRYPTSPHKCSATSLPGSTTVPFVFRQRNHGPAGPPKVMKNGFCSATTVPRSTALPFVISTEAQRSGEICGSAASWKCFSTRGIPKEVLSGFFSNPTWVWLLGSMPMRALAAEQPEPPLWNLSHKMATVSSALSHRY
jgi:hypothetical protein